MKHFKKFIYSSLLLMLFSCGTSSNFSSNVLDKTYFQNKTIYFTLDKESVKNIEMSGSYLETAFDSKIPPIIENVFKESIDELANETNFNFIYITDNSTISNNDLLVNVKLTNVTWKFGFYNAIFKTEATYKIHNSDRTYNVEGIRKSPGGDKSNNLRKSLKITNYNFLKELEK